MSKKLIVKEVAVFQKGLEGYLKVSPCPADVDGTFMLQCVVEDGVAHYYWVGGANMESFMVAAEQNN